MKVDFVSHLEFEVFIEKIVEPSGSLNAKNAGGVEAERLLAVQITFTLATRAEATT